MTTDPRRPSTSAVAALGSARAAWLAVNRADGPPHVTPVWFVLVADRLWVSTGGSAVKVALLGDDDRATLAIDSTTDRPLVAEARVRLHRDPAGHEPVTRAFAAKYGWDIWDPTQYGQRVLLELVVTRWFLAY